MRTKIFLAIILTIISACNKEKKKTRIDSDIIVKIRIENEEVILDCRTEKEYPCANYRISYSKGISDRTITIHFEKIIEPEHCLRAFGPARTEINLGIHDTKTYYLKFKLRRKTTEAELIVGNTISIKETKPGNVKIE